MARQKKIFNYDFIDGEQQIPATYEAICTKTGATVPIYHKILYKLIETKYKGRFQLFLKTFVKKPDKEEPVLDADGNEIVDNYKLNAYSDYLIICYKGLQNKVVDIADTIAVLKHDNEKAHIADCFKRNFNRDIETYVKEL